MKRKRRQVVWPPLVWCATEEERQVSSETGDRESQSSHKVIHSFIQKANLLVLFWACSDGPRSPRLFSHRSLGHRLCRTSRNASSNHRIAKCKIGVSE